MSERYSRLFALPEDLYCVGSPVVIAAGALLKDNQTGKVIGQLKLRSISQKAIKAVKVKLHLFDTAGNPIGESVEYSYLDLNAARDTEFGQKSPIAVPEAKTRSYQAAVTEVVFADQSVWTSNEGVWESLEKPTTLSITDPELLKQYQMHYGSGAKYEVNVEKDLWRCTCGALNHDGENCHICSHSLFELQTVDMEELTAEKDVRLAEAARKSAERQAAEDVQKAKAVKILKIVIAAICVVIAIVLLVTKVFIPNSKYNDAVALLEAGKYEEAAVAFEELGDHKNSADMKLEADYLNAARMIKEKNFSSAIEILERNPEYKDSQALYTDACYQYAHELWENKQYKNAETLFANSGDYLDANDWAIMSNVMHLLGSGDYQSAYSVLKKVSDPFITNNLELYENIYQNVVYDYATIGNIGLQEAVKILKTVPHPSQDILDILSQYETILECDGKYEFRSEETRNRYYFTIKRLFAEKQTIYADFEWTGYGGTFSDPGVVRVAPGNDYLCIDVVGTNSYTKKHQNFTLKVTPEKVICGFGYTYTRVE